jgi:IS1 family transposase
MYFHKCPLTFLDRSSIIVIMNKLTTEKRCAVVRALVEGCSIRSTVRMTGVAKNTVIKLLVDLGKVCSDYQDRVMHNLTCKRLQLDEIWSFVYAKAKNVPVGKQGELGVGDVWTWTAIDADTKLVPSWMVGPRDGATGVAFVSDLADRLAHRVQLTTDGHLAYLNAVEDAFGRDIDYAMIVKIYGVPEKSQARYSPPKCIGCTRRKVVGNPDPNHISTSYAERANLTMRMQMRRFTRLTNAFSKKVENHGHAVALHFMWYNFGRIHQTLRCTPAVRAGISDHVWSVEEIVGLLEKSPAA